MAGTVEKKLADLGIALGTPAAPVANYVGFVRTGNLLVVSGQLCFDGEGKLVAMGKLGGAVSVEDGQKAARACAINLLAQIKVALGDLDKVAARGAARRLHQRDAGLPRNAQGDERRLRPDGYRLRRQRPPCPHDHRRRGAPDGCRGRGRRHVRGVVKHMPMPGLDWLTARPVAHRGLHDAAAGVIENTASAFAAAIEGGFCDRDATCRSPPTAKPWCSP